MLNLLPHTNSTRSRAAKLSIACCLIAATGLATPAMATVPIGPNGWSQLKPAQDTKFVFVSSSVGNDANDGRTPLAPVRSLARAKQLMSDFSSDWMLLKRGDTWYESMGSWNFSGKSENAPVVISSYGDGNQRPTINPLNALGIQTGFGREVNHVAIVGIRFIANRPEHNSKSGIRWLSSGEGLLIEYCYIEGFKDNIIVLGSGVFEDVTIRRSVIVDSYSTAGHSQGLYVKNVQGLLIEENVFDSNGDNPDVPDSEGNGFNQNVYLQVGVTGVQFLGNITSNGPGAGVQLRSGGIAKNNLIYQNSLGMRFGYTELEWPAQYASGIIEGNVILGGDMIGAEQGIGLWVERFKDTVIQKNVIANSGDGVNNVGIILAGYGEAFILQHNVVYNWTNGSVGHSLKSSIRAGQGSAIMNNIWSMEHSPHVVSVRYSENLQFLSNTSFVDSQRNDLFTVDGSALGFGQWDDLDMTAGEEMDPVTLPDAGRDLGDYARSLGYADEQDFLNHARSMSRSNWDPKLTGTEATRFIRDGYLSTSFSTGGVFGNQNN
ncbi:MAG: right-handed parallel beta-helix repeat-containing protein [Phycisphaerales bacterium]|nr:right-handed parallel beta-helix repeat-containing protein [Phycisphaerales bacterium]